MLATKAFNLSAAQLKQLVLGGFKSSFFPVGSDTRGRARGASFEAKSAAADPWPHSDVQLPYRMKRAYIHKIANYYEKLEAKFGMNSGGKGC